MKSSAAIKPFGVLALSACMVFSTGAAHAADESHDDQTVDQQQLNEHQVQLEFSDYSFEATDDGEVEAINLETGETEEALPEETGSS
ncbi:hypothetical protein [Auritidibacter ignavus]|uniref:hypothetical protein n=1 Tax=Auritidibacter ignavus TaxID=678932 RepID=UPI00244D76C8|nr:hypothetical protein [Auritidibacter ignavus]WGH86533.1 hypothetical protein QDX24_01550 [Auritidibacter ignavus]WGH88819.1 hypothetical protein QDX22_01550 [Auritidibacter ignavus]